MAKTATEKNANKKAQSAQPLFYSNPVAVSQDRHLEAGLNSKADYSFTKNTNSAPINLPEFAEVSKYYPIVFTGDDKATPAAVFGLENNQNLFVNAEGEWKKEVYIPAYIRRYPFAFTQVEQKLILCVDEDSARFEKKAKKKDLRLFEESGEQSNVVKLALDFCAQFHKDQQITAVYSKELVERGLLKSRQVTATFKNKEKPVTLSGFNIIDEEKFFNLDAETLQAWHKNGFLALTYYHLLSLGNFRKITETLGKKSAN